MMTPNLQRRNISKRGALCFPEDGEEYLCSDANAALQPNFAPPLQSLIYLRNRMNPVFKRQQLTRKSGDNATAYGSLYVSSDCS